MLDKPSMDMNAFVNSNVRPNSPRPTQHAVTRREEARNAKVKPGMARSQLRSQKPAAHADGHDDESPSEFSTEMSLGEVQRFTNDDFNTESSQARNKYPTSQNVQLRGRTGPQTHQNEDQYAQGPEDAQMLRELQLLERERNANGQGMERGDENQSDEYTDDEIEDEIEDDEMDDQNDTVRLDFADSPLHAKSQPKDNRPGQQLNRSQANVTSRIENPRQAVSNTPVNPLNGVPSAQWGINGNNAYGQGSNRMQIRGHPVSTSNSTRQTSHDQITGISPVKQQQPSTQAVRSASPTVRDFLDPAQVGGQTPATVRKRKQVTIGPVETRNYTPDPSTNNLEPSVDLADEIDYSASDLRKMKYSDLEHESFDVDPKMKSIYDGQNEGDLAPRLDKARVLSPEMQRQFFDGLSIDEWDDAGDWFLGQFQDLVEKMRQARKDKRNIAMEYEKQVTARHEAVERRREGVEKVLGAMKKNGLEVLKPGSGSAP